MAFINDYCSCSNDCTAFTFPDLPQNPNCLVRPTSSEVTLLIMLPVDATLPLDWTVRADWFTVLGQTNNDRGRMLRVIGSIPAPEKFTTRVVDGVEITHLKEYTLTASVTSLPELVYNFMLSLQCNPTNYRLWYYDMGGYLYGGQNGLRPFNTDVDFVKESGKAAVNTANLTTSWFTPGCDVPRTYIPNFTEDIEDIPINPRITGSLSGAFGTISNIFG